MATCPECDADLDIDESDAEEGDQVDCAECGESFVVTGTDPLELELADEDDEDEDEDEDEEEEDDFGDDDDLDEEEEEEGEDWEE
jgi:alpha-aminoadipate carrier protein LysW